MENSSKKLKAKDFITVGIFTAILFAVEFAFGMLGYIHPFIVPKAVVVLAPTSMSIIAKIIGTVLVAVGSPLGFLTACGESWGWGFMCLAYYAVVVKEE